MIDYKSVEGWFDPSDKIIYDRAVSTFNDYDIFVEVGSFKGRSSVAMAENIRSSGKKIKFYCVDTWEGSEEHKAGSRFEDRDVLSNKLYDVFTHNTREYKDIINPIRKTSVDAAKDFKDNELSFIFIDAAHDYENVTNDLNAWYPKLKEGGLFGGHDWIWSSVSQAAIDFTQKKGLTVFGSGNIWWIE